MTSLKEFMEKWKGKIIIEQDNVLAVSRRKLLLWHRISEKILVILVVVKCVSSKALPLTRTFTSPATMGKLFNLYKCQFPYL